MKAGEGVEAQPVSNVEWVEPSKLTANEYNPNHVFPGEMELLRNSILEHGWVQPIYAKPDGTIIDGYHRWRVAQDFDDVAALTGGLVPVVYSPADISAVDQKAGTIRLNRARGYHAVVDMAAVVTEMIDEHGVTIEQFGHLFGMEREEVERLYDSGGPLDEDDAEEFSEGWVVADPHRGDGR